LQIVAQLFDNLHRRPPVLIARTLSCLSFQNALQNERSRLLALTVATALEAETQWELIQRLAAVGPTHRG
ncbi:MAG: hypothetical protein H0V37_07140, partial [Chloroflexia bacterium]|nr:hypothetical protein [Chloroflexia bacterium]